MKKIISLILVLMILSLVACSTTETTVPAGMKVLSDESAEYNLYIPENWKIDTNMGVPAAYYEGSQSGNDFSNISFVAFSGEDSQEAFWEKNIESIKTTFPDAEFEIEAENTLAGQEPAVRYVYKASVAGTQYKYMQMSIYKDGVLYLFTYTALPEYYSEHYGDSSKEVNMMIDNFSFKNN